ncbi:MAG: putative adenylyl-sulfate kinase [Anaerolineales bacterium]|nr:putative adenylyl-sulfate kinase [Anaerolineales bacterium]
MKEQQGFTLWFTGMSGAGKTTLAREVVQALKERGVTKIELLDGDVIRTNLSKGLGFSKEDRDTNIRRIGWVCEVLTRNDVVAVASAISPYQAVRDEVREKVGDFVEVYVKCPVEVLIDRDVKGLYAKALAGEIENFTGISDPYEEPTEPEVVVETDTESVEESVTKILRKLEDLKYIAEVKDQPKPYSEEDEALMEKRLRALGYL